MNKSTPEYKRVREEIAKQLVSFENKKWGDLEPKTIRFIQDNSQEVYLKRADSILKIQGIAIRRKSKRFTNF